MHIVYYLEMEFQNSYFFLDMFSIKKRVIKRFYLQVHVSIIFLPNFHFEKKKMHIVVFISLCLAGLCALMLVV